MKISIVIGSYNQKEKLKKVLLGFQGQSMPLYDFEVIVVDSGSKDGTSEMVKLLDPGFRFVFRTVENKGKSYARNYGIKEAGGKIIILTDADMIPDKDFLKEHLKAHEATGYSMCFEGLTYNVKDLNQPAVKANITPYIRQKIKENQKLRWYYFLSGNLSAPSGILKEHLFSEDFFGYGWEDIELGYRLYKKGILLKYLTKAINYHFHVYTFKEELERKEMMGFEADVFVKKHPELKNRLGFHPSLMFIYSVLKQNKKSISIIEGLKESKVVGSFAKYILSEYHYRHGYSLAQKYGRKKKISTSNNIKYDVSIVVVTYNNKEALEKCLDSIYKYTKNVNFEIIIIDNHSQDGTVFLIEKKFPYVKYMYLDENYGFAKASNIGIKENSSRYILLLNNDTLLLNNIIKDLFDFMEANKDISACGPKLLNEKLKFQRQGNFIFNLLLRFIDAPLEVSYLPMTAFFIKMEIFDKIGFLDENFFFYNEDLDFTKRMNKNGMVIKYLPHLALVHIGRKTASDYSEKIIYEGYKGGLYYVKKNYSSLIYAVYKILMFFEISYKILFRVMLRIKNEEVDALKRARKLISF